ncbi:MULTISPECIES: fumarylacetoacetate hydrolase family protein [Pseudomonadota]|uniref:2-hydroxyhepta-2,4-diene-1,7-dioate isomerase n=1 Tax=Bordetella petrii (strain ATCC BAA-461 / DSM 12804 / CCUG 43448 / CIP 107267 / Se-1111R) TaxID=340100 RepID=A9IEJ8_BORPD|nr:MULTISPECIES: fumarylacetoacetate hydrolase family protein [Pseudomonadota]CAP41764.1 2-hydroxyhepta-2,4-diene-1,7-dioate isomerase [Bordetella petrii]
MRLCLFNNNQLGVAEADGIRDVSSVLASLPAQHYPLPRHDLLIAALPALRPEIEKAAADAPLLPFSEVRLLSPVANPGKIVAAPVNYKRHLDEAIAEPETFSRAHVRQIQETGLFLKATSSLVGPSEGVSIRFPERRTDHEIELAVVIGKRCDRVDTEKALDYVAGYSIGLDITVRGPEERSLRKSIDSYTVLGPWLVTADEIADPSGLEFELRVDGKTRQKANTRDLILNVRDLIVFASAFYTLMPGDVILTGTPEGVGPIQPGNVMSARIEGIGEMNVSVSN